MQYKNLPRKGLKLKLFQNLKKKHTSNNKKNFEIYKYWFFKDKISYLLQS
jgi:hypothetical protein